MPPRTTAAPIPLDDKPSITPAERFRNRSGVLILIGLAAWCLLFLAMAIGGILFLGYLANAKSSARETAAGAVFAAAFLVLYILVRCIEKVLLGVERYWRSRLPSH